MKIESQALRCTAIPILIILTDTNTDFNKKIFFFANSRVQLTSECAATLKNNNNKKTIHANHNYYLHLLTEVLWSENNHSMLYTTLLPVVHSYNSSQCILKQTNPSVSAHMWFWLRIFNYAMSTWTQSWHFWVNNTLKIQ